MLLSDAIIEGSKLRPQGYGGYTTPPLQSDIGSAGYYTCALGAAAEHTLKQQRKREIMAWEIASRAEDMHFAINDNHPAIDCPQCDGLPARICDVISHLNDEHHWTREAIAEWLKGLGY